MRFVGRGHPAVRATHGKTLELTPQAGLTERGTCIVAVGVEAEPPVPLAGRIRVRIAAGSQRFAFEATANPAWDPAGPVVIRRGPLRLPGTFATDADAAASDLPRELVAALQDPDALVTLDVAPAAEDSPVVVLLAADATRSPDAVLAAELHRADTVIVEDAAARRLAQPRVGDGVRTLVVACRDLPGASVPELLATARVDTAGLPSALAVAAACPSRGPLTVGGALDSTPASHRLVISMTRAELPALLVRARNLRGTTLATVVQEFGRPLPATPDDVPDLPGADVVHVCLHPTEGGDEVLDPRVRAALEALVAGGVPTRTAAAALAALTGWERRRAYAAVLEHREHRTT